ncbi:hypothetical protein J6590_033039 [Homalodisca vitripennis]|nr:hypothetical protein J6590_033039 [Homalodisca vitripennis]
MLNGQDPKTPLIFFLKVEDARVYRKFVNAIIDATRKWKTKNPLDGPGLCGYLNPKFNNTERATGTQTAPLAAQSVPGLVQLDTSTRHTTAELTTTTLLHTACKELSAASCSASPWSYYPTHHSAGDQGLLTTIEF